MLSERDLCRASPAFLARKAEGPRWVPARHHAVLSEVLVDVAYRRLDRVTVAMPPQNGKSTILAKAFPAWWLGRFEGEVIYATYQGDLAASWGRKARDLLEEVGPSLFGVTVAQDSRNSAWWTVRDVRTGRARGSMKCAGIEGSLTGKGADLFLLDDPYKGPKQANSRAYRAEVEEFYAAVAHTRLSERGAVVICHTRWNEDDLIGRKQREAAAGIEAWHEVRFPAIAEAEWRSPREWRRPGEPLWPAKYPLAYLQRVERITPSYLWLGLFQQRPSNAKGAVFRRQDFRYVDVAVEAGRLHLVLDNGADGRLNRRFALEECRLFATVDLAFSESQEADYTVAAVWAWTPDADLCLLDVERERLDPTLALPTITALFGRWPLAECGVEDVQFQRIVLRQGIRLGLPMRPLKAHADKFTRSIPAQIMARGHRLFWRRHAPWLGAWEEELLAFVRGKESAHDDQVDVLAYAALRMQAEGPRIYDLGRDAYQHEDGAAADKAALASLLERLGLREED